MNRRWAEAALAGNTIIWGATFVVVKSALADITPVLFLALRFSLASLALLALWGRVWGRVTVSELRAGMFVGSFLFFGYLLQTIGLRYTSAPKSAFITGLTSVVVPLLAMLVYRIRPQISELFGILVATIGLGLMTWEGAVGRIGRGDLLTLGCTVAYAAHIVTLGHYSEKVRFEVLAVLQVGMAAVLALTLFWWVEAPQVVWRPAVVFAVLVTGVLATALAFSVQSWAQQYTSSTRTALIYTLEPVFAWLTSYWLVGEGLSRRAAAGAAFILGGVLLVELKPLNLRVHPSK